jgi:hypothetical protein
MRLDHGDSSISMREEKTRAGGVTFQTAPHPIEDPKSALVRTVVGRVERVPWQTRPGNCGWGCCVGPKWDPHYGGQVDSGHAQALLRLYSGLPTLGSG